MYFSNFPSIVYDATGSFDFKVVTNLLRRVALRQKVSADVLVFDYYDVKDGETPEIIAHKLYGDSELHWIILLINNITDRYHQWPKSYTQWLSFLEEKYPTDPAVSNYDYEENVRNEQSQIRLLDPSYLPLFVEEFENLMQESIV